MGIGRARGDKRALEAARMAVSSPLLEASVDGARGVLLMITGGSDLGLYEVNEAADIIAQAADPEANIIFGAVIDDAMGDEVKVTVIAAGFSDIPSSATTEQPTAQVPSAAGVLRPVDREPEPSGASGASRVEPVRAADGDDDDEVFRRPGCRGAASAARRRRRRRPGHPRVPQAMSTSTTTALRVVVPEDPEVTVVVSGRDAIRPHAGSVGVPPPPTARGGPPSGRAREQRRAGQPGRPGP